ncbi:unnamed protein product [Dibothriocephalus latus]|uniref:Fibrillar collagen NC1 domain-containing protein n=1 Tax=Dibothriocephalus latus TaxID=60516 RepID=A0A3P7KZL3_DIBLA|nr:unnamed protein product [Dibothriocephalus latus]
MGNQGPPGPPGPPAFTYDMRMSDDADQAKYIGTDSIELPDGSRGLPARSCKILARVKPHLEDDAIQVYCRISSGETCISAKTPEFDYEIPADQLSFLKVLSDKAKQEITVNCRQSSVTESGLASRLLADNDLYFTAEGPLFRYKVLLDDCQYKKDSYGSTIFEVSSRPRRLPLRDISFADLGGDDRESVRQKLGTNVDEDLGLE